MKLAKAILTLFLFIIEAILIACIVVACTLPPSPAYGIAIIFMMLLASALGGIILNMWEAP